MFRFILSGDMPLWRVYWLYWLGGSIFFTFVFMYMMSINDGTLSIWLTMVFVYIIFLYYSATVAVGTWRSANRYAGHGVYRILAKLSVALGVLGIARDLMKLFT